MGIRFFSGMVLGLACLGFTGAFRSEGSLAAGAVDSCGPSYLEIYDFPVGDVFQDEIVISQGSIGSGYSNVVSVTRRYRITSRLGLANGYRYTLEGLYHKVTNERSGAGNPLVKHEYGEMSETREYLDTASHPLNACKDRMVRVSRIAENPSANFYTRVQIAIGDMRNFPLSSDTTRLKIMGTPIGTTIANLYTDSAGNYSASGASYSAVYAAGLGCVRIEANLGESGASSSRLQGYIRGGATIGLIWPDEEFMPPVSTRMEGLAAKRKSDRIRISRSGLVFLVPGGPGYRDLRGESVGKR
jgi:hypothetical protein